MLPFTIWPYSHIDSAKLAISPEVRDPRVGGTTVAVVVEVPGDEFRDTLLDWRRGPVADDAHEVLGIGPGVRHVANLQGQQVLLRLAPEAALEHLDVAHQLDRTVVPDVVEPVRRAARCRVRSVAIPVRVGRGDVI